jgi:hypothetical protein
LDLAGNKFFRPPAYNGGLRDWILRGVALFGVTTALLTEILSPFHLLRRGPLVAAWLVILVAAAAFIARRRPKLPPIRLGWFECAAAAAIIAIAIPIAISAWLSPPNSADAMAYHMPRVVYWAQSGSIAFFPTPYFNQITLQPLAEYFMLHTYVLSGGDHYINLVAFFAYLFSIVGVSAIAAALGLSSRAQAIAALFCATIPNGILQASGAKNDWILTLWLVLMVYFAVRRNTLYLGLAFGLALASKATAYLFAPPILLAALITKMTSTASGTDHRLLWSVLPAWSRFQHHRPQKSMVCATLAAGILLVNGPQYVRNLRLSGSPLGYDSAHGDGLFRWRNEHPGLKSTVSNALRHLSEQLAARDPRWNQRVYDAVIRTHHALGIDPEDPDTTWRWGHYGPPKNANHEADANSHWHLLLLAVAGLWSVVRRNRQWMRYAAGLLAAFLLFCFYLKWQQFMVRLELPLFVLGAPLAAWFLIQLRPTILTALVCLFLLGGARLPALQNWTRPLKGPHNLLTTSRDDNYFNDMVQWSNGPSYKEAVDRVARTNCNLVGIDISQNQLEYPFQALLRERNPQVRFVHTGVANASARYYAAERRQPCAVLCPDCAGVQSKIDMYRSMGPPQTIDRFLLWIK